MTNQGVDVFITSNSEQSLNTLPSVETHHSLTAPLVQVVSFYKFIEQLSRELGLNPDEPAHLRKVTETV